MKMRDNEIAIERGGDMVETMFGISGKDSAHILTILRDKLYSNKILAVVREYCTNAQDAHAEIGSTEPIEVNFPNELNSHFEVRDYGSGLSEDDIRNVYVMYGASTKRQSNSVVGQLGLGCKSAFAYVDKFQITSWYGGEKKVYCAYIDETGMGKIALLSTEESSEREGVQIQIPVKKSDLWDFAFTGTEMLSFFDPAPNIQRTYAGQRLKEFDYQLSFDIDDAKVCILSGNRQHQTPYAIMGGVPYPINYSSIDPDCAEFLKFLEIHLYVNIGDLDVAAHRESLEYTEHTRNSLEKYIKIAQERAIKEKTESITNADSYREANEAYRELKQRHSFWGKIPVGTLTWDGKSLDGFALRNDRHQNTIVAEYWRPRQTGNGYRWFETMDVQADKDLKVFELDDVKGWKPKMGAWMNYRNINPQNVVVLRWKAVNPNFIKDYMKERVLDDFDITLVSNCKVPKDVLARNSRQGFYGPRSTTHLGTIFKLNGEGNRNHKTKSKNWTKVTEVPDEEKYYVVLDKFFVKSDDLTINLSDFVSLLDLAEDFKPDEIYGVKSKGVEKLDDSWVPVMDKLKESITNSKILQTYVDKCSYTGTVPQQVELALDHKNKFPKDSVALNLISAVDMMKNSVSSFHFATEQKVRYFIRIFGMSKEVEKMPASYDIQRLVDKAKVKYKLTAAMGVFPGNVGHNNYQALHFMRNEDVVTEIVKYIKMVEKEGASK